ncbi:MAG: hypothetical protein Q4C95_10260 [Planctomycetia bacterium]|nr:hypothetical protein [Planctomycetia bacterium]
MSKQSRGGFHVLFIVSSGNLENFDLILNSCQLSECEQEEKILTSQMIANSMKETQCVFGKKENIVFTAVLTFGAFLSEMFHTGTERTTQAAVTQINQLLIASEQEGCALNNGRYCMVRS